MPSEPAAGGSILHLIRRLGDTEAVAVARAQQAAGYSVSLLLLQDAVLDRPDFPGPILACRQDDQARGGRCPYPSLDYDDIVRLLFEHRRVISW